MKPLPMLLISCVVAIASGVLTHVALRPADGDAVPGTVGSGEQDRLRVRIAALADSVERMQAELHEVVARVDHAPASSSRSPEQDVDAAVRRYLERHHPELALDPADEAADEAASAVARGLTVDGLFAELDRPGLDQSASQAIWTRARAAGLLDELVAAFELRAQQRPDDPEAQLDVGSAYLQKIFDAGDGPERGVWATRADEAFDRALAIDPRHWEARFTKAVSLSFWPPLFGKQAEAISQFEVLVEQQASGPLEPRHAQSYELLGNLYQQLGQQDRAAELWRTGAELFPDNRSLLLKAGS